MKLSKLLVIVGPTGTGKTSQALKLAKKYHGEIINADSRQVYAGLDIATGKEVKELFRGKAVKKKGYWIVNDIPIHLYDIIAPDQPFSLVDYQQRAYRAIAEVVKKGKLPILVGGSGLYIQAVVDGLKVPKAPPNLELRKKLSSQKVEALYRELLKIDPLSAQKIDGQNPRRIIRALEVFYQTGESIEALKEKFTPHFDLLMVGLTASREMLYQKSDRRVEEWFKLGLVREVEELMKKYPSDLPSLSALGYQQTRFYLEKKLTLEEATQRIKFALHNYIRKQLSWFKRDGRIFWFDVSNPEAPSELNQRVKEWYTHL